MRTVFADSCYWVALLNRNDVQEGFTILLKE
jgi:hypothetical protein